MPVDFRPPMTDDLCDPALLTVMGDSTIFGRRHLNVGTPEQVMGGDTRASETLSNRNTGTPDEFVPSTCWSWMTITFDRIILVISRHSIPILQCHTTRPHHHSCMQLLDAHTHIPTSHYEMQTSSQTTTRRTHEQGWWAAGVPLLNVEWNPVPVKMGASVFVCIGCMCLHVGVWCGVCIGCVCLCLHVWVVFGVWCVCIGACGVCEVFGGWIGVWLCASAYGESGMVPTPTNEADVCECT